MEAFMLDKEFLRKLDVSPRREVYARITSLTFDEQPIECIDGRITGGSVNIDGTSSVRRTCSLSLVTEKLNINDYIWGIRTKFHLEVGLKNEIDDNYPDICWFNLGYYVTTSFTSSISANSRTISIQGKDKMCLLNGDIGGNLPSIIDFGREEWYDYDYEKVIIGDVDTYNKYASELYVMDIGPETGDKEYNQASGYAKGTTYYKKVETYTPVTLTEDTYQTSVYYIQQTDKTTKLVTYVLANDSFDASTTYYRKDILQNYHIKPLLIKKIIKEGVHTWGGEPYHNIIINDLDTYGMEQLTYRDNAASDDDENTDPKPLFIIKNLKNDTFQVTLAGERTVYPINGKATSLDQLTIDNGFIFDTGIIDATKVALSNPTEDDAYHYTVLRVNDTEDAGYRITDLTYVPEDGLTCSVGETFTSVLDKIKTLLDDFEYFYNLDGQFVFQRKKTYTNVNFSAVHNLDLENLYTDSAATAEPVTYDFSDNFLISAININPTLTNVKNDYAIQGKRTTASGAEVPIHLRYAIDKKPVYYKAIDGTVYVTNEYYNSEYNDKIDVVREFTLSPPPTPGAKTDIDELRQDYWDYIIKQMPRSSKDPNDYFFWSKHRSSNDSPYEGSKYFGDKWLGIYFKGKQKISYTVKPEEFDIQYTPGWWDLDAWMDFYYLITGELPTQSLALYSGFREKTSNRMSQRLGAISTSSNNDSGVEYINTNIKFDNKLITNRDNFKRIFFVCDASEYIDAVFGVTTERAGLLSNTQILDKCQVYNSTLSEDCFTYLKENPDKRPEVRQNNYQKNRYYIEDPEHEGKYILDDSETYDNSKTYYERVLKPNAIMETAAVDQEFYTVADPATFGTAAANSLTCVEAVSQFIDNGITVEYILSPYNHWHDNWTPNKYYYIGTNGSYILDDGEIYSEDALPYYEKLDTPETFVFPCWIYNPQFPEGSFRQAFEKGFWKWLRDKGYTLTFTKDVVTVDWREIIYQMSKDYLKYSRSDTIVTQAEIEKIGDGSWEPYGPGQTISDKPLEERLTWRDIFTTAIMKNNPKYYWTGVTGYEQYYTDLNAFWRQLYNPFLEKAISKVTKKDGTIQFVSDYFLSKEDFEEYKKANGEEGYDYSKLKCSDDLAGWNSNLYFNPTSLDFWFDFLDEGEVAQNYGVRVIGLRTKAVSNDKVSAVYFTKLPTICFYTSEDSENWKRKTADQVMKQSGYTFALLPKGLENNFTISSRQLSAKDYLDSLLYQFSYIPEQLSITALPIYYLEPNTRIYVHDEETAIDGEYIVNKITLPLTYNGTMSISANKAPERII